MKVLFIAPRMHTNQYYTIKGLLDRGIEVSFYAFYQGSIEDHSLIAPKQMKKSFISKIKCWLNNKRYAASTAESKNLSAFRPSFFNVAAIIKKEKPDLIILRERSIGNAKIAFVCKLLGRKNVIIYNQAPLDREYTGIKSKIFPRVRYTPIKSFNDNYEIVSIAAPHTHFVPLVYEVADYVKESRAEDAPIEILEIGKYRDYKNHYVVVDAVEILLSRNVNNFRVSVVGQMSNDDEKEYYENLLRYAKEKNLLDYIDFRHSVPFSEVDSLYRQSDVFVLPSKFETAGMVIVESMAHGLCTICSNKCGLASYVLESNGGDLFDYKNPEDLADKLQKYITDRTLIQTAGENGKKYVKQYCSTQNYVDSLNKLCQEEFGFSVCTNV